MVWRSFENAIGVVSGPVTACGALGALRSMYPPSSVAVGSVMPAKRVRAMPLESRPTTRAIHDDALELQVAKGRCSGPPFAGTT
jgi:hypothetical protein